MESNLRSIEDIPPPYRSVFEPYPCFNVVQSEVLDDALHSDKSMVIAAPTGSGKSAIFEMAIIRLLMTCSVVDIKAIYISPVKALCQEKLVDWHKKFSEYDIKCMAFTSDTDDIDPKSILNYQLILSTPEKWDVITRRWKDNQKFVSSINLFMVDEVHLLNADTRGSTLEVIVSRMKTIDTFILNQGCSKIRFITASATIPNVEDIAEWIGPADTACFYKFSEDVRPVKLNKIVYGFSFQPKHKSAFKFDLSLNYKLQYLIPKYSDGLPTLIFCNTRKSVEMTAKHLVENLQIRLVQQQKEILNNISAQLTDTKLKQYVVYGIAFHHAGLVRENRYSIEESFRQGHIPILVTTSTLAMGVNLPAHLVIIKSTKCYDCNDGYKDYDEMSIFQMIGRAGRRQFDTSATALILTTMQDKAKYEKMVACTQSIESNLHKHLTEHLNAEIVLKTITDLDVALRWLSSTFLYVRAKKCPEKYKLPSGLTQEKIDKKLLEICQIDLNKLVSAGMVKLNEAIEISPTVVGEIMAKYYVAFDTMKLFTQISGNEILIQLLGIFSKCHEFSEIRLRSNDKKCLNLLNKHSTKESNRFPLTGRITTANMKVNCIIQAILGNLEIQDQSILNDSMRIMRCCERLSRCLIEYLETRRKCYVALLNATILAKCFRAKLWENSPYVVKQLTGIGQVFSLLFVKAGLTTFERITNTNPRVIEMHIGRKPPFGNNIVEQAKHVPRYEMKLMYRNKEIILEINLLNFEDLRTNCTVHLNSTMTLLIGDNDNNLILYEKYSHSYMLDVPKIEKFIEIESTDLDFISAHFISDDWVGFDCNYTLELSSNCSRLKPSSTKNKQTMIDSYMHKVKGNITNKKKNQNKTSTVHKDEQIGNEIQYDPFINGNKENLIEDNQKNVTTNNLDEPISENKPPMEEENSAKLSDESIKASQQQFTFSVKKPTPKKGKKLLVGKKMFHGSQFVKSHKNLSKKKSKSVEFKTNDSKNDTFDEMINENLAAIDNIEDCGGSNRAYLIREIVEPITDKLSVEKNAKVNSEKKNDFIDFSYQLFDEEFIKLLEKHSKELSENNNKKQVGVTEEQNTENLVVKPDSTAAGYPIIALDSGKYNSEMVSNYYEVGQSKSIKWRSPLIHSPREGFSPFPDLNYMLDSEINGEENNSGVAPGIQEYGFISRNSSQNQNKEKNRPSSSRKSLKFPLRDQDYIHSIESNRKKPKTDFNLVDLDVFGLDSTKLSNVLKEKSMNSQSAAGDYFSQLDKQSKPHTEVSKNKIYLKANDSYSRPDTPESFNSTSVNISFGNIQENISPGRSVYNLKPSQPKISVGNPGDGIASSNFRQFTQHDNFSDLNTGSHSSRNRSGMPVEYSVVGGEDGVLFENKAIDQNIVGPKRIPSRELSQHRHYNPYIDVQRSSYFVENPHFRNELIYQPRQLPTTLPGPDSTSVYMTRYAPLITGQSAPRSYIEPYSGISVPHFHNMDSNYFRNQIPHPQLCSPPMNSSVNIYEPHTLVGYPYIHSNYNRYIVEDKSMMEYPAKQYLMPIERRTGQPGEMDLDRSNNHGQDLNEINNKQERPLELSRNQLNAMYGCTPKKKLVHTSPTSLQQSSHSQRGFETFKDRFDVMEPPRDHRFDADISHSENYSSGIPQYGVHEASERNVLLNKYGGVTRGYQHYQ